MIWLVTLAGATITPAAAKRLATLKRPATWPGKAKVNSQIIYLDAAEEEQAVIAGAGVPVDQNGYFIEGRVSVRNRLEPGEVDSGEVTHMDASRAQSIGSSAGLIPFVEKNYVLRSLMGSNQQRQAVPLIKPESPIVGTGFESIVARKSGQLILAEADGTVTRATASEVIVKYKDGKSTSYQPIHFARSNDGSCINQT